MSKCYALRVFTGEDGEPLEDALYIMEGGMQTPQAPFTEHLPRSMLHVERLFMDSVAADWSKRLNRTVRTVQIVDVGEPL